MQTAIAALLALGLAVPSPKAKGKARAHNVKRKKKTAKAPKPPAPPLAGAAKTQAIASLIGQSNLQVKRVFKVGLDELSEGIQLEFTGARLRVGRDFNVPKVEFFSLRSGVNIRMPGKPGAAYFFDCGVGDTTKVRTIVSEPFGARTESDAPAGSGRIAFAHSFGGDSPADLFVTLRNRGSRGFSFSSCEVTELAPKVPKKPINTTSTQILK